MKAKIIWIGNLKGGVGKTTSAYNLSYELSRKGKRVLLIDNDKQGDSSRLLGRRTATGKGTDAIIEAEEVEIRPLIQETDYKNLHVITANLNLLVAIESASMDYSNPTALRMKKALEQISGDYDYILIDNAPDINLSIVNAIAASDLALIPLEVDGNTIEGIDILLDKIQAVKKSWGVGPEKVRVFLTKVDETSDEQYDAAGEMIQRISGQCSVMGTYINKSRPLIKSSLQHKPIRMVSPRSAAARKYKILAEEIGKLMED